MSTTESNNNEHENVNVEGDGEVKVPFRAKLKVGSHIVRHKTSRAIVTVGKGVIATPRVVVSGAKATPHAVAVASIYTRDEVMDRAADLRTRHLGRVELHRAAGKKVRAERAHAKGEGFAETSSK